MLTLQKLKDMKPHEIIASGLTIDNRTGINMSNSSKLLCWVAVRGGYYDWAIYCTLKKDCDDIYEIARTGDKVFGEDNIKKLVTCDDESYKMYRR